MKRILLLLFLISASFAIVNTNAYFGMTDPIDGGDMAYFRTNIRADITVDAQSVNGQNCPGTTYRITPSLDVKWATNGNPEIVSIYPACGDNPPRPDCPVPPGYNGYTTNVNVAWLDSVTFNNLLNSALNDPVFNDESVLNTLTVLHRESVTYHRSLPQHQTEVMTNRDGYANIYCKGDIEIKVDGVAQQTIPASSNQNPVQIQINQQGQHTVSAQLKNTDCFAVLKKTPENSGTDWFRVYFFADVRQGVGFGTTGTTTVNVQPANPNMNLVITAPPANTLFNLDDQNHAVIRMTVRNNGELPVKVDDVLPPADMRFSVEPYQNVIPGIGIDLGIDDGFEDTINVGRSKDLYMNAIDTQCQGPNNQDSLLITLAYSTTQPVCGNTPDDIVQRTYKLGCTAPPTCETNNDCPQQEICWEGECRGFDIEVTPDEVTAEAGGDVVLFDVECTVDGVANPVDCDLIIDDGEQIGWNQASDDDAEVILNGDNDGAMVTTTNDDGTVYITADYRGNGDTSTLEILPYNGYGLVLEPEDETILKGNSLLYRLTCYNDVHDRTQRVDCGTGSNIIWSVNGPVTLSGRSNEGATATANEIGVATITASKTIGRMINGRVRLITYSDTVGLTIAPNPNGYGIDIYPDSGQVEVGQTEAFYATCYNDIITKLDDVPCGAILWRVVNPNLATLRVIGADMAQANVTGRAEGQTELTASTVLRTIVNGVEQAEIFTDTSPLTIGPSTKTCTVERIAHAGNNEQYGITCSFGGDEIDCGAVQWDVQGGRIVAQDNTQVSLVLPQVAEGVEILLLITANVEGGVTCSKEVTLQFPGPNECVPGDPNCPFPTICDPTIEICNEDPGRDKEDIGCVLTGPSSLNAGGTYSFYITCNEPGRCNPIVWNVPLEDQNNYFESITRRDIYADHITLTVKDDEAIKQLIASGNLLTLVSATNRDAGAPYKFYCSMEPKFVSYTCTDLS